MKGSSFDSGKKAVLSRSQQLFMDVLKAYTVILNSHPVIALNPERDAPTQSRRLSFDAVNYRIDIERSVARALKDKPSHQAVFFKLVAHDRDIDAALKRETIEACAKQFDRDGLDPVVYLKPFRRESQRRAA